MTRTRIGILGFGSLGQYLCDLIADVCHPRVVAVFGPLLLRYADLLIGSPTAFVSSNLEASMRERLADPAAEHGATWRARLFRAWRIS